MTDVSTDSKKSNLILWEKGKSGNPAGRPKGAVGLAGYIRERSDNGKVMVTLLLRIAECTDEHLDGHKVTIDHRLEAVRILLNRGFGRPVEQLVVEGSQSLSDIIAQAYKRRQVGDGETIKDARATIKDASQEGEQAPRGADESVDEKKEVARDSKTGNRIRGEGGAT